MDRSVANLSTEQLYRKRASDRANQRALRARQKTRVQELEDEVADLKKKLDRSERRVNYLENNEQSLREIIESARASLQAVDHFTDSSPVISLSGSPFADAPASDVSSDAIQGSTSSMGINSNLTSLTSAGLTLELPLPSDNVAFDIWEGDFCKRHPNTPCSTAF